MSVFDSIKLLSEDPILGLQERFVKDTRPFKINLGIGSYKDQNGKPKVMEVVREAEQLILSQKLDKEYLPIEGHAEYIHSISEIIFGNTIKDRNYFAVQTIGGTGALRIGADFFARQKKKKIYVSQPTWPNHYFIFNYSGLHVEEYPYYDSATHKIDLAHMWRGLKKIPEGSIVVLQVCGHNPTGIDLTFDQWKQLSELFKDRNLFPFFDFAYQGLGKGLEEDAQPVRYFVEQGHEMFVASSCSKNFGLYGERVGMLTLITNEGKNIAAIKSHIKKIIRSTYSMPALQGARIVSTILQTPILKEKWQKELIDMRNRIFSMRKLFQEKMSKKKDFSFISEQQGLFSYIGITKDKVQILQEKFGIYFPEDGRINIAGLNDHNLEYVAESISSIL